MAPPALSPWLTDDQPVAGDLGWLRLAADPDGAALSLARHDGLHGALPRHDAAALLAEVEHSGLTGRGGAAFPVHRKLAAVAAQPGPRVVVANGAEGEPASRKDHSLLVTQPHLVLDGLQLAAQLVGATQGYLYVHPDLRLRAVLGHALHERRSAGRDRVPVAVVAAPRRFVAGEASAAAAFISGEPARPRPKPPQVFESGVHGRPTLVQNVETLAHVALIARRGAEAFRALGDPEQPGTMLFTVTGAVHRPGVVEAATGTMLESLLAQVGGCSEHPGAVLLGGYHGAWVGWPDASGLRLANSALRARGIGVGAGVVVVLPASACGVRETARVLDYLADESAGQCGPCVFGMPRLAATYGEIAAGRRERRRRHRLDQLAGALERRGGCAHPDGSLRFLRSAMDVFADELRTHAADRCTALSSQPVLPTPRVTD
jgi:NADH:ubiquinone oxidoreductase subunit F (NADH-binding)